LNRLVAQKFADVFDTHDHDDNPYNDLSIPIVPTFGNNDILPHNIFDSGPNLWTNTYLDIWREFIPEEQRHQFAQGGWFSVEVIPRQLVVFSLNSLYFFDNNAAVDGCSLKSEPGYRQLNWLRIQLQFARERGMKAMIIGHVPPARTSGKSSWDETCWQKYTLWQRQYRDVIVGNFYGHMNYDHFMLQDFNDIDPSLDEGYGIEEPSTDSTDDIEVASASSYFTDLRRSWSKLPNKPSSMSSSSLNDSDDGLDALQDMSDDARPAWEVAALRKDRKDKTSRKGKKDKKGEQERERKQAKKYLDAIGGEYAQRFSLSHVAPSVVPNYFPTIRVYEYNVTGLGQRHLGAYDNAVVEEEDSDEYKIEKKKDNKRKRKFTIPKPPSKSAPPGPAYSPQPLTLLGYTQYYANLTYINNDFHSSSSDVLESSSEQDLDGQKWNEGKHGKHNGKKPKSDAEPRPNKFEYQVLYNTTSDEIYKLKDMTVRSYLELAKRIGKKGKKSKKHKKVSVSEQPEALDEDFEEVDDLDDVETEGNGKKGKKDKKKKKKHQKGRKVNKVWLTFLKRAFSGAVNTEQLRQQFDL